MTEFELFFRNEWPSLTVSADHDHEGTVRAMLLRETGLSDWKSADVPEHWSWDRKAAWLVYEKLRRAGHAGPAQGDLFG